MPGANLARIDLVVAKILFPQHPLFVADQAIRRHAHRVELHLDLHVFRDGQERAVHLLHQNPARFIQRIEVGVIAVPFVGEFLHRRILQIFVAHTEHAQKHATLGFLLYQPNQFALTRHADIEIAVSRQNHAIDSTFDEIVRRNLVGELNSFRTVGRTTRLQTFQCRKNLFLVLAAS